MLLVAASVFWLIASVEAGGCWRPIYGRGADEPCADNYSDNNGGTGPLCYHNCPEGKFECGAMCTDSEGECNEIVTISIDVLKVLAQMEVEGPKTAPAAIMQLAAELAPDLLIPLQH